MRHRRTNTVVMLVLTVALAADAAHGAVVERRGGLPPLEGSIVVINDNGVSVRSETGATQVVLWDSIHDVDADQRDPTLEGRLETAEQLWRARSRLQRGDAALAEPLFERLFAQYRGSTHETALIVAEGLLRCRLGRMANEAAMVPALEVMRLQRAGIATTRFNMLQSIFDPVTGLCTELPPVWIDPRALRTMERALSAYESQGDEVVAAIAQIYRRAAQQQLGHEPDESAEQPAADPVEHEAVKLLKLIVDVHQPDRTAAFAARNRLANRLETLDTWSAAWARFALGSSMVNDRSLDTRLAGLVHLLHLPAAGRFRNHRYLAGLALKTAADVFDDLDDPRAAETLRSELLSRYPGHPAARPNTGYARSGFNETDRTD